MDWAPIWLDEPWTADHPRDVLAETVQTALSVGTVGRALAWRRALTGVPHEAHGDYAGAVADWLLEQFEPTVIQRCVEAPSTAIWQACVTPRSSSGSRLPAFPLPRGSRRRYR